MEEKGSQIVLVGCNHHRTPLEVREHIALSPTNVDMTYSLLGQGDLFSEYIVLNTCNRVEIYGLTAKEDWEEHLYRCLSQIPGFNTEIFQQNAHKQVGFPVVEHLFSVASGLDSQIIGETEILGQVKNAYSVAQDKKVVGKTFHRLMQKTFQASKWARTHTGICSGQVSLGNVAVDLANRIFGHLKSAHSLIVGSGDVGRDVAKALRSRGIGQMYLTSRTTEHSQSLAEEVGGLVIPFKTWEDQLLFVDIAIFATSAPETILKKEIFAAIHERRDGNPLFLIDLAVPRDIDTEIGEFPGVFLYNLNDLAEIANENLALRSREVVVCQKDLKERAERLYQSLGF